MGNRATIVLCDGSADNQPITAIYLQWNGGPESVYSFLDYASDKCRPGDASYFAARFVQIIGNYIGDNLSLGLMPVPGATVAEVKANANKIEPGDNGVYLVAITGKGWECIGRGHVTYLKDYSAGPMRWSTKATIAKEIAAATAHDYNKDGEFLDGVAAWNDPVFAERYLGQPIPCGLKVVYEDKAEKAA